MWCSSNKRKCRSSVRTIIVVLSILLWFIGCAIMSFSGWLLYIDEAAILYYKSFTVFSTALYVIFASGIVFLVLSLLGTCGATMKSKVLIFLSLSSLVIVCVGEIIAVTYFASYRKDITMKLEAWTTEMFKIPQQDKKIVDRIQANMKCCGFNSPRDYPDAPPSSCLTGKVFATGVLTRQEYYQQVSRLVLKRL